MSYFVDDTIVAIASAAGGALRGIIRVSGPNTLSIVRACFVPAADALNETSQPSVYKGHVSLSSPLGNIPAELYLWPTNRSYTRQPSAEIHTIGSPPILDASARALCKIGARLAEPGEFTMRAFLAGRLDLTQAEAVLGVIDARNQRELGVALTQLAGGLASPLNTLREQLLDLLAHLEAGLDFVEEDIEFISAEQLSDRLAKAEESVRQLVDQMDSRLAPFDVVRIVLRGMPNVGKSSLLNALVSDQTSIVSNLAGTTRDYVAKEIQIEGISCLLIDTAGIEKDVANRPVQIAAQEKAAEQAASGHLELFCVDASRPLNESERAELAKSNDDRILVRTKCDLLQESATTLEAVATSSKTGEGVSSLRAAIARRITESPTGGSVVPSTAARCRESLRLAAADLERARDAATIGLGEELVAADVRGALDEIGKVVGAVYTDDVLDRIFSRFCIGK